MIAKGATGEIEWDGEVVSLRRRSLLGGAGEVRTYRVEDLQSVDFRAASSVEGGFIRVLPVGSSAGISVAHDLNAVGFRKEQEIGFIELYSALHERLYGRPPAVDTLSKTTPVWMLIAGVVGCLAIIFFYVSAVV